MLIDTHAHLNFPAFEKDKDKVIGNCLDENVWMINVGTNFETSKKAVEIAQEYEKSVYATIGLHPINLDTGLVKISKRKNQNLEDVLEKDFDYEKYKKLAKSKKVVAIGEIGFDYYWKPKTTKKKELFKKKQKELFLRELKLAQELNLPVIFHCRMAHQDLIEILNSHFEIFDSKVKGVIHGFVGTLEQLNEYLKMGFYIGFNGIIFKKIEGIDFEKIIKNTPIDRILIETDCPYLIPPPATAGGGLTRNEPQYVKYVAQKIAKIKNLTFEKIAEITTQNAKGFFGL